MIPTLIHREYQKLPPNLRILFWGLITFSVIVGFTYLFPAHYKGETIPFIVDQTTGAKVCPQIIGCEVDYNRTGDYCQFREAC